MIDPPPEPPEDQRSPEGTLRPTSPQALTVWGLVGLVGGWLFHAYSVRQMTAAPLVTWAQPLALFLVAAILVVTARATWRTVHQRGERLQPHQAVNRLVLARACAYVGVLAVGAYLGYALSWLGDSAELAEQRAVRSLIAALGGACVTVGALVLERACRVRNDQDGP
ncbi:DUF3180 domain-containing protein [Nocardioides agariphilus]|jgi:hypothetical protein|uniref:DUF3180 domain-containing protein n=1 Tax=Nocardioides agariphilus TaxID=433664 RepID=A0A930VII3_9ACTN|nr:DUF3180 domain-containing protein [Nocardioides agariphilus]MBF4768174.1 DUF3180 domain-containing protein [Nocardioides agariphilus]